MINTIKKIYYGDTGSGDFVEVTISSVENSAILMGNESLTGRSVIYKSDVDALIEALKELKENYL